MRRLLLLAALIAAPALAQDIRPARSTMQVGGLVDPGWLVEIEVTAAEPRPGS